MLLTGIVCLRFGIVLFDTFGFVKLLLFTWLLNLFLNFCGNWLVNLFVKLIDLLPEVEKYLLLKLLEFCFDDWVTLSSL